MTDQTTYYVSASATSANDYSIMFRERKKEQTMLQPTKRELPPGVHELLKTTKAAVQHRKNRLALVVPGDMDYSSPAFELECVLDTFKGTQFDGESHRMITPYLMEAWRSSRKELMAAIDTRTKYEADFLSGSLSVDVVIFGSGPHGAAVAANLREMYPKMTTLIVEKNERLGGQWRNYGDKPVFAMNSRVRRADRRLPAIPRMEGSINPLGRYAPLELSDVVSGNYAMNTEMGDVTAINGFINSDFAITGAEVTNVRRDSVGLTVTLVVAGNQRTVSAKCVVDARGISPRSAIAAGDFRPPRYFTAEMFYRHFGTHKAPLEPLNDLTVMVIGGGDGALTCLEAMLGNLPKETYGERGGRSRPKQIIWAGAPGNYRGEIAECLRSRYKNGIVQALPNTVSAQTLIKPTMGKVGSVVASDQLFEVAMKEKVMMYPNVVVDCTNAGYGVRERRVSFNTSALVGPNLALPASTQNVINNLGISENTVSLWATMPQTDKKIEAIAEVVKGG